MIELTRREKAALRYFTSKGNSQWALLRPPSKPMELRKTGMSPLTAREKIVLRTLESEGWKKQGNSMFKDKGAGK